MQITRDESGHLLKIAGALEIGTAEELRNALRDFISGDRMPVLDLSEVTSCDAAALQLLCSARKTAELLGSRLEYARLSDVVRITGQALGLPLPEGDANAI